MLNYSFNFWLVFVCFTSNQHKALKDKLKLVTRNDLWNDDSFRLVPEMDETVCKGSLIQISSLLSTVWKMAGCHSCPRSKSIFGWGKRYITFSVFLCEWVSSLVEQWEHYLKMCSQKFSKVTTAQHLLDAISYYLISPSVFVRFYGLSELCSSLLL